MKVILQAILIGGLGFIAQQYFPFWIIAAVAALVGLMLAPQNSAFSFLGGFIGAAVLWGGVSWWLDTANNGTLSGQLGELFSASGLGLLLATAFLGGLIGGLGAMTGTLARKVFIKEVH